MKLVLLISSLLALVPSVSGCTCATLAATTIVNTAFGSYTGTTSDGAGGNFDLDFVYNLDFLQAKFTRRFSSFVSSCSGTGGITSSSTTMVTSTSITIESGTNDLGCAATATASITFDGSGFTLAFDDGAGIAATGVGASGDCAITCSSPTGSPTGAPSAAPSAAPVITPTAAAPVSPSADPPRGTPCFSADASVMVQDLGLVPMKDLEVGDSVLDALGNYQPIYTFGHQTMDHVTTFLQIHASSKQPVEASPEHFIFHARGPVRADAIKVGDFLQGIHGQELKVTKISTSTKSGLYAPFTASGTIVVDGVAASSYISLVDTQLVGFLSTLNHDQIHAGLAPLRVLCMGVMKTACSGVDTEGMSRAVAVLPKVTLWVQSQSMWIQVPMAMAYLLVFALCWSLEMIFGPTLALSGGVVLAMVVFKVVAWGKWGRIVKGQKM